MTSPKRKRKRKTKAEMIALKKALKRAKCPPGQKKLLKPIKQGNGWRFCSVRKRKSPSKKKRKRRTKAQVAADKAAHRSFSDHPPLHSHVRHPVSGSTVIFRCSSLTADGVFLLARCTTKTRLALGASRARPARFALARIHNWMPSSFFCIAILFGVNTGLTSSFSISYFATLRA